MQKEEAALAIVREGLQKSIRPIAFCSFGKDSIVMLHLIFKIRKVPIVFIRHHKFQQQFEHSDRIAREWDLEVYNLMPCAITDYQQGDYFDILEFYRSGPNEKMVMADGIRPYDPEKDGERYFCAAEDLLLRPKAYVSDYPWDVTFVGHKSSDNIHVADRADEMEPIHQGEATKMVFPIHDWSDEEIWAYIKKYDLPYDRRRYDEGNEAVNPDRMPACYRCMDVRLKGQKVDCPKYKKMIPNFAKSQEEHDALRSQIVESFNYCRPQGRGMTEAIK